MTSGLKYSLSANSTRVGVNHSTNVTFNFNTGTACFGNEACIMNGNTKMVDNGYDSFYYSWYAATAGTGTTSTVGESTGSICPKGWRLPANYSVDSSKSYGSITEAYLGIHEETSGNYVSTLEAIPIQLKRAGDYYDGTFHQGGERAFYWSSTAAGAASGYDLRLTTSYVSPQYSDVKYCGFPIRCVNTDL